MASNERSSSLVWSGRRVTSSRTCRSVEPASVAPAPGVAMSSSLAASTEGPVGLTGSPLPAAAYRCSTTSGSKGHGPSAGSDLPNMMASSHDDPSVSENLAAHSPGSRATALDGRVRIPPSPLRSRLAGRAGESRRLAARSPAIAARKVRPDTSPTTILPDCGVALGKAIRKTNEQAPYPCDPRLLGTPRQPSTSGSVEPPSSRTTDGP